MSYVENLLRETLNDPKRRLTPSGSYVDEVSSRARHLRRHRSASWLAAATAAAAIVVLAVVTANGPRSGSHDSAPDLSPAPPAPGVSVPFKVGDGSIAAAGAFGNGTLFMAQTEPNEILAVSPLTGATQGKTAAIGNNDALALDAAGGKLWEWSVHPTDGVPPASSNPDGTTTFDMSTAVRAHQSATLALDGGVVTVHAYAFAGAAYDGKLWLATDKGLYVMTSGARPSTTHVLDGGVYSVAADPTRHRVLVGVPAPATRADGSNSGTAVTAFDSRTLARTRIGSAVSVGKESIAVVEGQIWLGGYGSGSTPRLVRLDPKSLKPLVTSEFDYGVGRDTVLKDGPGATVWPGQTVLWARDGSGVALSCIDPHTGKVLQQWQNVDGPVVSTKGRALVLGRLRLLLNAECKG